MAARLETILGLLISTGSSVKSGVRVRIGMQTATILKPLLMQAARTVEPAPRLFQPGIGTLSRTAPRFGASASPLTNMCLVWTYTDLIALDSAAGGLRTAQPVDKIGDFCFELLE